MESSQKRSRNNSPEGLFICQKIVRKIKEALESFLDVQSHIHKAFSKKVRSEGKRREVLRRRRRISRNRREGFEDNTRKSILYCWLSTATTNI